MISCTLVHTIYRRRRAAPVSLVRTVNQRLQDSQIFKMDVNSIVRKILQHCCHGSSFIWASRQKCNTLILQHERWDTKLAFCQARSNLHFAIANAVPVCSKSGYLAASAYATPNFSIESTRPPHPSFSVSIGKHSSSAPERRG